MTKSLELSKSIIELGAGGLNYRKISNGEGGSKAGIDDFSKSFYNKLRAREEGRAGYISMGEQVETCTIFHGFHSTQC